MFYKIIRGILYPILYILFRPIVINSEYLPKEGRTIIYCNHRTNIDPLLVGVVLPRQIFFMAKRELFKNPISNLFMKGLGAFPVNRGTPDISAIKNSLKVLREEEVFGIFPEGTRSKSGKMQKFSHGIASIAHKSKATVVPIAIIGEYKIFKRIKVVIGKPLNFSSYYDKKSTNEVLELMTETMHKELLGLIDNN